MKLLLILTSAFISIQLFSQTIEGGGGVIHISSGSDPNSILDITDQNWFSGETVVALDANIGQLWKYNDSNGIGVKWERFWESPWYHNDQITQSNDINNIQMRTGPVGLGTNNRAGFYLFSVYNDTKISILGPPGGLSGQYAVDFVAAYNPALHTGALTQQVGIHLDVSEHIGFGVGTKTLNQQTLILSGYGLDPGMDGDIIDSKGLSMKFDKDGMGNITNRYAIHDFYQGNNATITGNNYCIASQTDGTNKLHSLRIDNFTWATLSAPTNMLHVGHVSVPDPVRIEGLETDNELLELLAVDGAGVVHKINSTNVNNYNLRTASSDITIDPLIDGYILIGAGSNTINTPESNPALKIGQVFHLKDIDAGTFCTIETPTGALIDGLATFSFTVINEPISIIWDGTNYHIF